MINKVPREKYIRAEKTTKDQDDFKVLIMGICIAVFLLVIPVVYDFIQLPSIDRHKCFDPSKRQANLYTSRACKNPNKE